MSTPLLTTAQVAELLGCSKSLIVQWRSVGRGPDFIKSGGYVRYHRDDVQSWIDAHRTAA